MKQNWQKNILDRIDEYEMDPNDINVGDNNRFKKYLEQTSLKHYGIKGMQWGVRRYQNPDGSYTAEGKRRYSHEIEARKEVDKRQKEYEKLYNSGSSYEKIDAARMALISSKDAIALAKTRD